MLLYIKIKRYCNLHFFYFLFLIYMGVHCTCHFKSGKDSSTSLKNREITNQVNNPLLEDTTTVGVDNTDLWQALRPPLARATELPQTPFSLCTSSPTLTLFKGKAKAVPIRPLAGSETFLCKLVGKKELTVSFGLNTFKHRRI